MLSGRTERICRDPPRGSAHLHHSLHLMRGVSTGRSRRGSPFRAPRLAQRPRTCSGERGPASCRWAWPRALGGQAAVGLAQVSRAGVSVRRVAARFRNAAMHSHSQGDIVGGSGRALPHPRPPPWRTPARCQANPWLSAGRCCAPFPPRAPAVSASRRLTPPYAPGTILGLTEPPQDANCGWTTHAIGPGAWTRAGLPPQGVCRAP